MRRLAMLALVVLAFATSVGSAQIKKTVMGTVRDALGTALVGARVTDGSNSTVTVEGGAWSLVVDPAIMNTITASKPGIGNAPGYVPVSQTIVPFLQPTIDFALPFRLMPSLSPGIINALPASLSLEARSLMPRTLVPLGENCVIATDDRTGAGITMLYASTDAGGVSKWVGGIPLPQGTDAGTFRVTFEGRNCSTLKTLTDTPAGQYVIDAAPPVIGIITPQEGFLTVGVIPLPSRDGSTRVFGPIFVQVDATDDVGLKLGRIELTPGTLTSAGCSQDARGATSFRYVCGPFLFIQPGKAYTLTVTVSDLSGKTNTVTMPLRVAGGI
jgi:hypothetical protein